MNIGITNNYTHYNKKNINLSLSFFFLNLIKCLLVNKLYLKKNLHGRNGTDFTVILREFA